MPKSYSKATMDPEDGAMTLGSHFLFNDQIGIKLVCVIEIASGSDCTSA
jgi:hypothetical protein